MEDIDDTKSDMSDESEEFDKPTINQPGEEIDMRMAPNHIDFSQVSF